MIPQSFINSLIERIDIADVVATRVQLKNAGSNQMGLCPFHDEKTPSFNVYPDGHYHCFGCGAHGTTLGFLMEMDGLTFPQAVEALAAIAGVEVPRSQAFARKTDTAALDVLDAAALRFQDWLRDDSEGQAARKYLRDRGLGRSVVEKFGVGLAPAGWERLKTALKSFGEDKLVAAGLLAKHERGRTYDRFRARIVFPIRGTHGRVIGFGGRVFGDPSPPGDGPKYLNSPDSEMFHKGRELYGLFEARRANRRLDSVVVVEGYMDVVALAQHGVTNTVATLGTAIGSAHFEKLFRHRIDVVVCCFDGDQAGREAAWKAVDAAFPALSEGRQLKFVFLPEGEDPDSLVRDHGAARFESLIRDAVPVADYFLDRLQSGLDLNRVDARALLCDMALPSIARLPDSTLRTLLLRELARLGRTEPAALENRLRPGERVAAPSPATTRERPSKLAGRLLRLLVKCPQLLHKLDAATRQRLLDMTDDGLLAEVLGYLRDVPDGDTATLLGRFFGHPAYAELVELAQGPLLLSDDALQDEFTDGARRYVSEQARHARRTLLENVQQSGTLADLERLRDARA